MLTTSRKSARPHRNSKLEVVHAVNTSRHARDTRIIRSRAHRGSRPKAPQFVDAGRHDLPGRLYRSIVRPFHMSLAVVNYTHDLCVFVCVFAQDDHPPSNCPCTFEPRGDLELVCEPIRGVLSASHALHRMTGNLCLVTSIRTDISTGSKAATTRQHSHPTLLSHSPLSLRLNSMSLKPTKCRRYAHVTR